MRLAVLLTLLVTPVWGEAMYGHLPYPEAKQEDLVTFQGIKVHKDVLSPLKKLQAGARKAGANLVIRSGFRPVSRQQYLFYGIAKKRNQTPEERAKVSAPPGHSEHHTGFTFDFDDGDTPAYLNESFADTKAGKWLLDNGPDYGFELSFPPENTQGVMYEPWHWRWVGRCDTL